ncbi:MULTISPECIES: rhodanese-like domain-containing protein [Clostridium]|uniref:Rhodanese-like domain-containing protein n=1 Tax=Clostridium paridis TaxID=2803863 RepID=A0A937K4Z9_9CLOT|nr:MULTISPECIES: rhodanese-like domain-containing protein [Clostridium]MBL4931770.1 rhodanese-like domain-containing protein [Clostridium paridis]
MFGFLFKKKFSSVKVSEIDGLGKINIIDVREPYEYKNGHVPNARNIPMNKIIENTEKYLDKEKEYHIICQSGTRSSRTCGSLASKGYKVINVAGGTGGYKGRLKR